MHLTVGGVSILVVMVLAGAGYCYYKYCQWKGR